MAKRRKKTRTHLKGAGSGNNADGGSAAGKPAAAGGGSGAPKSFVMRSGNVGRNVGRLVQDVRRTMEPNTATRLRERKSNKLRDFLTMCGPLGVSHLIMFGQKQKAGMAGSTSSGSLGNVNLRIARTPRGPTVTFRVNKFALASDVAKAQRRARAPGGEFQTAPLLVLNNFGSAEKHVKLLVSVFQGLFPPIQVQTMHLSSARRIVLLNYHEATGTIDWRHYLISVRPVGVSRRVRKVVEGSSAASRSSKLARSMPDLGKASDIADYLLGSANGEGLDGFETDASSASEAESDVEDGIGSSSKVTLPSRYVGRGNASGQQRAVRLRELGPRMELRCVKIEEGIPGAAKAGGSGGGNEVLWHDYVQKSGKEGQKLRKEALEKEKLRKQRREEQEENVRRKKEASGKGKAKAKAEAAANGVDEEEATTLENGENDEEEEEDEFAYEDAHGTGEAVEGDLFEDDDGLEDEFDDEASMNEDEDGEEGGEDEDEDEDEDDSDLTPFEIDEDEEDDDFSEEEVAPPPRKKTSRR